MYNWAYLNFMKALIRTQLSMIQNPISHNNNQMKTLILTCFDSNSNKKIIKFVFMILNTIYGFKIIINGEY